MYVRRKNSEYGRIKRSGRKNKTLDTFSTNFGCYLKLLFAWAAIMVLDFLMEFRFEYIWPCWLWIRTINDSFKYQGLAFAIFFTLIALSSDIICYMLVPSSWLFIFGSTCVWIELVWHAERGLCVPTIALCFLFLYMEVAVRLRDPKTIPLSIDLCRPFAAHCIGYPVFTLGFGLKSLLSHQFTLRKQRKVKEQNLKYFCLLDAALPEDVRSFHGPSIGNGELRTTCNSSNAPIIALPSNTNEIHSNSIPPFGGERDKAKNSNSIKERPSRKHPNNNSKVADNQPSVSQNAPIRSTGVESSSRNTINASSSTGHSLTSISNPSLDHRNYTNEYFGHGGDSMQLKNNGDNSSPSACSVTSHQSHFSCDVVFVSPPLSSNSSLSDHDDIPTTDTTSKIVKFPSTTSTTVLTSLGNNNNVKSNHHRSHDAPSTGKINDIKSSSNQGGKHKETTAQRLEDELRKMRNERQNLLACEVELRSQVAQLTAIGRVSRTDSAQAHQEAENLQAKLANINQRFLTERNNLQAAEKRLVEERRLRISLEQQLASEKRSKKETEEKDAVFKSTTSQTSKTTGKIVGTNRPVVGTPISSVRSNSATNTSIMCNSDCCSNRVRELESQLKSVVRELASKEVQLANLRNNRGSNTSSTPSSNLVCGSGTTTDRQNKMNQYHQKQVAVHAHQEQKMSELAIQLAEMQEENQRLSATLKEEDKMKQELLTAYHNSLKEISELNATLTSKEYDIMFLNTRLDGLNPNLCDYVNLMDTTVKSSMKAYCLGSSNNQDNLSSTYPMPVGSASVNNRQTPYVNGCNRNDENTSFIMHGNTIDNSFHPMSVTESNIAKNIDCLFSMPEFSNQVSSEPIFSCPTWPSSSRISSYSCVPRDIDQLNSFNSSVLSCEYSRNGLSSSVSNHISSGFVANCDKSSSQNIIQNDGFLLTNQFRDESNYNFNWPETEDNSMSSIISNTCGPSRIITARTSSSPPLSSSAVIGDLSMCGYNKHSTHKNNQPYTLGNFKPPSTLSTIATCMSNFRVISSPSGNNITSGLGDPNSMSTPDYLNQLRNQLSLPASSSAINCDPSVVTGFNEVGSGMGINNVLPFEAGNCNSSCSIVSAKTGEVDTDSIIEKQETSDTSVLSALASANKLSSSVADITDK